MNGKVLDGAMRQDHDSASASHEDNILSGIGAVAARTGVSERTLRYYEEVGLLHPAAHRPGGSRRYCETDVKRVQRIRELQDLMGFNLEEIRDVISAEDRLESLRGRYRESGDQVDQRHVLEEAITTLEDVRAQVGAKLGRLEVFLAELDARVQRHQERLRADEPDEERLGDGAPG